MTALRGVRCPFAELATVFVATLVSPPSALAADIAVVVEPRLLAASAASALSYRSPPAGPYDAALRARFAEYSSHAAVTCATKFSRRRLKANLYLAWALDRDLRRSYPTVTDRLLRDCAAALTDFETETAVAEFGSAYLEAQRGRIEAALDPGWTDALEAYFGETKAAFTVYLTPAQGDVSFGGVSDDRSEVWAALGPLEFSSRDESFFASAVEYFVAHEFIHGFLSSNVVSTPAFDELGDLLEPVAADMAAEGYGRNWQNVWIEHIVRAVTCRQMGARYGDGVGDECIAREVAAGFRYVPVVVEQLRRYEADRERWPAFSSFVPEISAALQAVQAEGAAVWWERSPYRTIEDRLAPTAEWALLVDASAAASFVGQNVPWSDPAHVVSDLDSVPRGVPVIAVGHDLGATLLAPYADDLPFRVEPTAIEIAGWRIEGENLAMIASMDRPGGSGWMTVYTTNTAEARLAPFAIDAYLPGWFWVADAAGGFCVAGLLPPAATMTDPTRTISCPGRAAPLPAIE